MGTVIKVAKGASMSRDASAEVDKELSVFGCMKVKDMLVLRSTILISILQGQDAASEGIY